MNGRLQKFRTSTFGWIIVGNNTGIYGAKLSAIPQKYATFGFLNQ
jgi:hypothetical protein